MGDCVGLRGSTARDWKFPFKDTEIVLNSEALLDRIRSSPGSIAWVAIAPDVENPSALVQRIREADPSARIVLLGADAEPAREDRAPRSSKLVGAGLGGSEAGAVSAALRRERAYVRSLLDTVEAVILVIELDGTIREWNRRAESLYGVSRAKALGRIYFEFLPEEERDRVRGEIRRLAAGGEPTRGFENAIRTPAGARHVLWNAALVEGQHGAPAILATGIDLTEAREAERILRETQRRAFEAEKRASLVALTASISHDVATPMTAILVYAELLEKSVGSEKNRKRASTIVEQVRRVSQMIDTLLKLARAEQGSAIPVELAGLLDKALDFYREKCKARGIEIERDYRRAPQVLGNPGRLHHVFLTLVFRTLEAMPGGGMLRVVLAETEAGDAEIRICHAAASGDHDLRTQIFEDSVSTGQRASGASLDLLVTKAIVEDHAGTLALTSDPSRGTELRLSFPRLSQQAPESRA
jgi:PAS domain S-box-containing protein